MLYRVLSDAVVVLHLAFIVFVAVGGFLVWRWRWLVSVHVPAVVWGAAIIVIGFDCPLTPLEKGVRERGGEAAYEGGFVDRYVEGVVLASEARYDATDRRCGVQDDRDRRSQGEGAGTPGNRRDLKVDAP